MRYQYFLDDSASSGGEYSRDLSVFRSRSLSPRATGWRQSSTNTLRPARTAGWTPTGLQTLLLGGTVGYRSNSDRFRSFRVDFDPDFAFFHSQSLSPQATEGRQRGDRTPSVPHEPPRRPNYPCDLPYRIHNDGVMFVRLENSAGVKLTPERLVTSVGTGIVYHSSVAPDDRNLGNPTAGRQADYVMQMSPQSENWTYTFRRFCFFRDCVHTKTRK